MKRRRFVESLGAIATCGTTGSSLAQSPAPRVVRIGVLCPFSPAAAADWHAALEQGLTVLGWHSGGNIAIEYRFAGGNTEKLKQLAAELMRLRIDLIVSEVTEATQVAKQATRSVPIVMVAVGDPVAAGLVDSLARPGGNITGLSQNIIESVGKRLELLKSVVPNLTDVVVLWNPEEENSILNLRELSTSSLQLSLKLVSLEARGQQALNRVLASDLPSGGGALYVAPGPLFVSNLARIATFARQRRLASIFHLPDYVRVGGLLAYGPDRIDLFRRTAGYIDKILKGAKPADLPVEQPTKYDLSINMATARAIGLSIPPLLSAQASEMIE